MSWSLCAWKVECVLAHVSCWRGSWHGVVVRVRCPLFFSTIFVESVSYWPWSLLIWLHWPVSKPPRSAWLICPFFLALCPGYRFVLSSHTELTGFCERLTTTTVGSNQNSPCLSGKRIHTALFEGCLNYFSVAAIRHHGQDTYKRVFNLGVWFQRVRAHDDRKKAWQQEQLQTHILYHR